MSRFTEALAREPFILTDGGIETRILFETDIPLDPTMEVAGLVMAGGAGAAAMRRIYRDYLDVGRRHDVPMIIGTPTFRAHPDRVAAAGLPREDGVRRVNAACTAMQMELRAEQGAYADKVFIAGVIGPRGDAYRPEEAPDAEDAAAYHALQAGALAAAGVDFLSAPAFPAAPESLGVARAMAATGLPYILSFVLRRDGTLLDGTHVNDVIARIDAAVAPKPAYYSVSCTHSSTCAQALDAEAALAPETARRIRGLKANGSALPPEDLVKLGRLDSEPPAAFAAALLDLRARFGLFMLGGCCGTTPAHIDALATALRASATQPGF